jgi:hypothetical protein
VAVRVNKFGALCLALYFPGLAFAGMGPVSTLRGRVVSFDEKKVRLKVGRTLLFVDRDTIDERSLKIGAEVDSVSPSAELFGSPRKP